MTRKRSTTIVIQDPRDEQIRQLQQQLAQAASKNDARQIDPSPPPNREEKTKKAIDFVTQTMKALEAFKKDLMN